jgi:hypothetical protein
MKPAITTTSPHIIPSWRTAVAAASAVTVDVVEGTVTVVSESVTVIITVEVRVVCVLILVASSACTSWVEAGQEVSLTTPP